MGIRSSGAGDRETQPNSVDGALIGGRATGEGFYIFTSSLLGWQKEMCDISLFWLTFFLSGVWLSVGFIFLLGLENCRRELVVLEPALCRLGSPARVVAVRLALYLRSSRHQQQ